MVIQLNAIMQLVSSVHRWTRQEEVDMSSAVSHMQLNYMSTIEILCVVCYIPDIINNGTIV